MQLQTSISSVSWGLMVRPAVDFFVGSGMYNDGNDGMLSVFALIV